MSNRSSAKNSRIKRRQEEDMLEHKVKSLQAQAGALAAELATLEIETKELSNENAELKERHKVLENRIHLQDARNKEIKLEIQWLKMMTSSPAMGHKHSTEVPTGFTEASPSTAGGDDVLPQCADDDDHSPDNPLGNDGLVEGSDKPANPASTN